MKPLNILRMMLPLLRQKALTLHLTFAIFPPHRPAVVTMVREGEDKAMADAAEAEVEVAVVAAAHKVSGRKTGVTCSTMERTHQRFGATSSQQGTEQRL